MNKLLQLYRLDLNSREIPQIERQINDRLRYSYITKSQGGYLYLLKFRRDRYWIGCIYDSTLSSLEHLDDIKRVHKYLLNNYGTKL
jgi:hypothetical protein